MIFETFETFEPCNLRDLRAGARAPRPGCEQGSTHPDVGSTVILAFGQASYNLTFPYHIHIDELIIKSNALKITGGHLIT